MTRPDTTTRPNTARLRTLHGRSTASWVGDGLLEVREAHWLALSGARHVDYNLALFHGSDPAAEIERQLPRILAPRRPSIIALAGEARTTSALTEAGWARVGDAPLMVRSTADVPAAADPSIARRLTPAELSAAQRLVAEVYQLDEATAEVALTVEPVDGRTVWGLFADGELVSTLIAMRVDEAVVVWSMATGPAHRRHGYGRRLLFAALAGSREDGATWCVLHASREGEALYRACGFDEVERWDLWSRRRWVLAAE